MANEEKKFKLDELPDQGSFPDKLKVPAAKKNTPDPRVTNLKKMSDAERLDSLSQKWHFDKKQAKWGWLIALVLLIGLEKSGHMKAYDVSREKFEKEDNIVGSFMINVFNFEILFKHPLFLALLFPLFFKFSEAEGYFFEITFKGISAVKSIAVSGDQIKRVFVPWDELVKIEKSAVNKREVLQIHDAKGPLAQLIWDIDETKKKVIKQILRGLLTDKHPFRIFIEKEVT